MNMISPRWRTPRRPVTPRIKPSAEPSPAPPTSPGREQAATDAAAEVRDDNAGRHCGFRRDEDIEGISQRIEEDQESAQPISTFNLFRKMSPSRSKADHLVDLSENRAEHFTSGVQDSSSILTRRKREALTYWIDSLEMATERALHEEDIEPPLAREIVAELRDTGFEMLRELTLESLDKQQIAKLAQPFLEYRHMPISIVYGYWKPTADGGGGHGPGCLGGCLRCLSGCLSGCLPQQLPRLQPWTWLRARLLYLWLPNDVTHLEALQVHHGLNRGGAAAYPFRFRAFELVFRPEPCRRRTRC